jgi:hypothetical protein
MKLEQRLSLLASAVGGDIKILTGKIGDLTSLSTTAKGNIVAALNELYAAIGDAGASIDDTAGNGNTLVTWSADKIFDSIAAAKQAVKDEILGGASAAYDTLLEIQALLQGDAASLADLAQAIANRVRFDDVQNLTAGQKQQARTNIGALSNDDLVALVGDTDHDFVADYTTAKA